MLPDLIVTSLDDAPGFLRQKKTPVHCIVSIGDPGTQSPRGFHKVPHRLRLEFGDLRNDGDGSVPPPVPAHVEEIVRFADAIAGSRRTLVHCHAGISRSTAAAFIMTTKLLGPGSELDALDHVIRIRPIAMPNTRMVRYADEILGRNGALSRALFERNVTLPELE